MKFVVSFLLVCMLLVTAVAVGAALSDSSTGSVHSDAWNRGYDDTTALYPLNCRTDANNFIVGNMLDLDEATDFIDGCKAGILDR